MIVVGRPDAATADELLLRQRGPPARTCCSVEDDDGEAPVEYELGRQQLPEPRRAQPAVDDARLALPEPVRVADQLFERGLLRGPPADRARARDRCAAGQARSVSRRRRPTATECRRELLDRPVSFHLLTAGRLRGAPQPGRGRLHRPPGPRSGHCARASRRSGSSPSRRRSRPRSRRRSSALAQRDAEFRDAARGGVRARGGRPVRRAPGQEPGEHPGRRARRDRAERLLRLRTGRADADELRPDQPGRRREAPERGLLPGQAAHGGGLARSATRTSRTTTTTAPTACAATYSTPRRCRPASSRRRRSCCGR